MVIQWYPGHMAKAKRMLQENLKLVDVVVELVDARAPAASRNPDFDAMFRGKARVILMNKSDLANKACSDAWIAAYKKRGIFAAGVVSTNNSCKKTALHLIELAAKPKVERMREKGVQKVVRAMIVGIPNVGKSTFINRIAGASRAAVGDKPGVTRSKQWVKITPYLELMDTPGLLWPKIEDEQSAKHLAYLGSIKDEIMDTETLAALMLMELLQITPDTVIARYAKLSKDATIDTVLEQVAESRGFLLTGGAKDTERAAKVALDEFRAGKLGRITLERPVAEEAADGADS